MSMSSLSPEQRQDAEALADAVLAGKRRALAKALTLVESTRLDHRAKAEILLDRIMPHTGNSLRIGLSGVPGVGKSTFIERFGRARIAEGHRIAVLAVDPSSKRGGGSILGDKTRMEVLSREPNAFIRPSPAGETLGGVARRTREGLLLCEAAGFDLIVVETVGVGQSETAVADMTDLFVLLLLPAGGDELQGLKKGIVELADMVLVNKADGKLATQARRTAADYHGALRLLQGSPDAWRVPVLACSAETGDGFDELWESIAAFKDQAQGSGQFDQRRSDQALAWLQDEIRTELARAVASDPAVAARLAETEAAVKAGSVSPTVGARRVVDKLLDGLKP